MDWTRLQLSVLRGLGLARFGFLFLTGRSYFSHAKERINQEWHERAKNFLGLTMIVTTVSLVRERQRRQRAGRYF